MSILVDKHDYRREYPILVGGVLIFNISQYVEVNGYSNMFWGWGMCTIFHVPKTEKLKFFHCFV